MPRLELIPGDCRDAMRDFAALGEAFDSVVCDPPYDLTSVVKRFGGANAAPAKQGKDGLYARQSRGFMGKQWDGTGIAFDPETWRLAFDCLKPGGHLVAFGATRTFHRMAVAIEDAGFEIRDTLMWLYGSGFPKSHNAGLAIDNHLGAERPVVGESRWSQPAKSGHHGGLTGDHVTETEERYTPPVTGPGTAEAAAWEGWGTALKPAVEPIVLARKPLARIDGKTGTVAGNILAHGVGALNIDGCRVRDGSETGGDPPAYTPNRGNAVYGAGMGGGDWANTAGRFPANVLHDGSAEVVELLGDAARFFSCFPFTDDDRRAFYSAKASRKDRAGSKHPTVKPIALLRWLCRLVTPPGGRVLDPFAGSGTTLEAAHHEGFRAVGCEMEPDYQADILRRLDGLGVSYPATDDVDELAALLETDELRELLA